MCMEREEDAKVLASCKDLKLHGMLIEISLEKVESKQKLLCKHNAKMDCLTKFVSLYRRPRMN